MAIDERARHRLYERLEAVLGTDEAAILMEHLPPVGWADVATKRDLAALQEANRLEHELLKQEMMAAWRADLLRQTRTMIFAMLTTMTTAVLAVGGLAFAAARIT
jgi:hypothetical protein